MHIRKITPDEVDFALDLTDNEHWGTPRFDLELLEEYTPHALFVLESNDELRGMISAVGYKQTGYIGMLIVPKKWRRRGYGHKLMEFGIQYLWSLEVQAIMLDAVQDIVPLYEKFGFVRYCESLRFRGSISHHDSDCVRQMTEKDLLQVKRIDHFHFGEDRSFFLERIYNQHPELCRVLIDDDNIVTGFIQGRRCPDDIYIGPCIVNEYTESVEYLIRGIGLHKEDCDIRVGVLKTARDSLSLLSNLGLEMGMSSIRMILNRNWNVKFSSGMLSIGSPAKG